MKSPAPIFLYVTGTPMPKDQLDRIERAGYVAVAVPSLDAAKVLDLMPVASIDAISKAAFDAIRSAGGIHDAVREDFGLRVARALGTKAQ
jgi:hypothetical protein